mmetsp:Transcript_50384/g.131130  ORF Transcript_50384/g.131130 Transcript_50384/m.131130 type:complete len:188 (+) Transcript_50384:716-1279(+)
MIATTSGGGGGEDKGEDKGEDEDVEAAQQLAVTQRSSSHRGKEELHSSRAVHILVHAGFGWLHVGVHGDPHSFHTRSPVRHGAGDGGGGTGGGNAESGEEDTQQLEVTQWPSSHKGKEELHSSRAVHISMQIGLGSSHVGVHGEPHRFHTWLPVWHAAEGSKGGGGKDIAADGLGGGGEKPASGGGQ